MEKPFLPLLCRVVAGLNHAGFTEHVRRMNHERVRRGQIAEGAEVVLPVDDLVLSNMDNLGFVVMDTATSREIDRRQRELSAIMKSAAERMGPDAAAEIDKRHNVPDTNHAPE